MKKQKHIIKLCITLVVIALAVLLFINGLPLSKLFGVYDIEPIGSQIKYGLDLTGGVYVVLQADESEGEVGEDTIDKAIATIRTRIDSLGVNEPEITKQGSNKIRISIPDVEDEEAAIALIGQTAELRFEDPDGNVIVTGEHVKSSSYDTYVDSNQVQTPAVKKLAFDDEGTKLFADATEKLVRQADNH